VFGREQPELIRQILRWPAYHRRSPAHQGTSFVFSAAVTALLAVSASEGSNILRNHPADPEHAGERAGHAGRARLHRHSLARLSHAASPIFHIHLRKSSSATLKAQNTTTPAPREPLSFDIAGEERMREDIVDEVLAPGVWITRARCLRERELVEARPSIRLAVTAVRSRKECEGAAGIIKAVVSEAEMSTHAASGVLTILRYFCFILSLDNPYRMPAPVDHIYYIKYTRG
jgi:7-keto-8-aminopelargonate synthetase-like enzyme